jgi:chemotaxis protein histidine kinase CheA
MIDGFLTMVGGVHYVLPLAVVSECIDVPPSAAPTRTRTCGTFDLRGEVLPYIDLALLLRRGAGCGRPPSAERARAAWWSSRAHLPTAGGARRAWWSTACWASTRP